MSTPRLANKGCPLCSDRSIPENLNIHVNDDQTCADVHLQLIMLRYDNAMCEVGQEKYQELCCTAKPSGDFKTSLAFMVGAVIAGVFLKRVFMSKKRRFREDRKVYEKDDQGLPGTISFSSRSSRSSEKSDQNYTMDLEMPTSCYVNMDKTKITTNTETHRTNLGKQGKNPRDNYHIRQIHNSRVNISQSNSHSRVHRNERRLRDRSKSRSQPTPDINLLSRDQPRVPRRGRSRSRPRDISEINRSTRDRTISRGRAKSLHRPRDKIQKTHSFVNRSRSHSRARSRSRPREVVHNHSKNKSKTRRSQSRSRPRNTPEFEQMDLYCVNGTRLPTQVL